MIYLSCFDTGFGTGAVQATEKGVCRVELPGSVLSQVCGDVSSNTASVITKHAARLLTEYFSGIAHTFEDVPVDLFGLTMFRARILTLIRSIPYGDAKSYSEVACMAGVPRAVRAIGGAMAANPVPIIIPCHRVVASDGQLTGYSAPGGLVIKKHLLTMEHLEFKGEKIILKKDVINK